MAIILKHLSETALPIIAELYVEPPSEGGCLDRHFYTDWVLLEVALIY